MNEKGNGQKGKGSALVTAGILNLAAAEAVDLGKIFIMFDVKFSHGNLYYYRSFTTWISATNIHRAVVLPPDLTQRG